MLELPGIAQQGEQLLLVHAARKQYATPGHECRDQEGGCRTGEIADSPREAPPCPIGEQMHAAEVVQQVITGSEPEPSELGHIAFDPLNLDALAPGSLPGDVQPCLGEVDPRDLPTAFGQIHGVPSRATADVQCAPW